MGLPLTLQQRRHQVARNAWQETWQNTQGTVLGVPIVAGVPPGLNGALWQEDQESAARLAHYSRRRNWMRAGDSQQQANQEG